MSGSLLPAKGKCLLLYYGPCTASTGQPSIFRTEFYERERAREREREREGGRESARARVSLYATPTECVNC